MVLFNIILTMHGWSF